MDEFLGDVGLVTLSAGEVIKPSMPFSILGSESFGGEVVYELAADAKSGSSSSIFLRLERFWLVGRGYEAIGIFWMSNFELDFFCTFEEPPSSRVDLPCSKLW